MDFLWVISFEMKQYVSYLLGCLILISACQKEKLDDRILENHSILALGHGGMGIGSTYPMNSLESILKCLNIGMDGVEIDVQMTKDGVLVAFHGADLSENTNFSGAIHTKNWEEISNAVYTSTPYLTYKLRTLSSILGKIPNKKNSTITLDCKLNGKEYDTVYQKMFASALLMTPSAIIESQSITFLKICKNLPYQMRLYFYPEDFDTGLHFATLLNLEGLTISYKKISASQVEQAHRKNLKVAVWNTHSESDHISAINIKPDFIQTDRPRNLIKLFEK